MTQPNVQPLSAWSTLYTPSSLCVSRGPSVTGDTGTTVTIANQDTDDDKSAKTDNRHVIYTYVVGLDVSVVNKYCPQMVSYYGCFMSSSLHTLFWTLFWRNYRV